MQVPSCQDKVFQEYNTTQVSVGSWRKKSTVVPAQQRTLKHVVKLPYNSERAK